MQAKTPSTNAQNVLQFVPGLFIGQHAGGGKAEQFFIRGFDIDHGTDLSLNTDGMQVNMPTHAHGQGYADMHFLATDAIGSIDFEKGSYSLEQGNFATAGYVNLKTKDRLDRSFSSITLGQYGFQNSILAANIPLSKSKHNAYVITDFLATDNYFEANQHFKRWNFFGKWSGQLNATTQANVTISHGWAKWLASGQIPERAVLAGNIGHFGAIDSTEGGNTARTNINMQFQKRLSKKSFVRFQLAGSAYNFNLFSNFTFFLNDSVNGDQIRQFEKRNVLNQSLHFERIEQLGKTQHTLIYGSGFQLHQINDIGLWNTKNRLSLIKEIQRGNAQNYHLFVYVGDEMKRGKHSLNIGLRSERIATAYISLLDSANHATQRLRTQVYLPKLTYAYNFSSHTVFYAKTGRGFHTNDARIAQATAAGLAPYSWSTDLGTNLRLGENYLFQLATWHMYSEQEFKYVGDEGVVEPSGRSQRMGFDFSFYAQPIKQIILENHINYAFARSLADPVGEDYLPLSPALTASGRLIYSATKNIQFAVAYRHMGDRPGNETNTIIAKGYTVCDVNLAYTAKQFEIMLSADNVFNVKWRETQFLTNSRLVNESTPVEEMHYTPGTPFFFKARLRLFFNT